MSNCFNITQIFTAQCYFSACTVRATWYVMWAASSGSHAENDFGPAAAAVLDQPAHFSCRVQLGRGASCYTEPLWVLIITRISMTIACWIYQAPSLLTGLPQHKESSPKDYIGQGLFPDYGEETLPEDEEEDEDEQLSMVALESELQKYLNEDWRLNFSQVKFNYFYDRHHLLVNTCLTDLSAAGKSMFIWCMCTFFVFVYLFFWIGKIMMIVKPGLLPCVCPQPCLFQKLHEELWRASWFSFC